jgi:hypothetical protein
MNLLLAPAIRVNILLLSATGTEFIYAMYGAEFVKVYAHNHGQPIVPRSSTPTFDGTLRDPKEP